MILLMLLVGWLGPKYLALLIISGISYYVYKFYKNVARYPKGPTPIPILGNAHQITPYHLHDSFEEWSKIYGNIFTVWFLGQPVVVLMRSDNIREALIVHGDNFVDRPGDFFERVFQTVDNGGVLFASGDNWREQRRNAIHILRDFGVGKSLMEEQIHSQLDEFMEYIKGLENKEKVDLYQPLQVMVANIINKLLFGYSYPHSKSERLMTYSAAINSIFTEMFGNLFMLVVQIFPPARKLPYIGYKAIGRHVEKYQWCLNFVKEDVKKALADYTKDQEPTCFAQAYYQKMDTNEKLDMENLYNVCADFFMAGQETTSNTLRWAMLYLAGHPDIQEKLRKEVADVIGYNRVPSLRDRPNMTYMNVFITELQRVCNLFTLNIQRKTNVDVVIDGKKIPANTNVVPQVYSVLYDEKLFPEPKKLNPERFLNKDGSINSDLTNQVIAFGLGKRQCAGESLARAELFLGITTFVQNFCISPSKGTTIDYEPIYGTALSPKPHTYKIEEIHSAEQ